VRELEHRVQAALRKARVARGTTLLAAASGGPDSTALLCALAAVCPAEGVGLRACTVDHGIRPPQESAADVAFVRRLCDRLHVVHTAAVIPAGRCAATAREARRSLEEVARDLRLELLRRAAGEAGAADIALGHTRDDRDETLLMRVLQGSGPEGLRGIALRRGPFIRPLLSCSRAEVLLYLQSIGQDWREDSSNTDQRFLRNGVRHTLVPALQKVFPGWRTGLHALSRKLALAGDAVRVQAQTLPWREDGQGFSIEKASLGASLPAVRARSLLDLYDRFRLPDSPRRLSWRFLSPVLGARLPAKIALEGHGTRLRERAGRVWWGPHLASNREKGYFIEVFEAGIFAAGDSGMSVCFSPADAAVEPGGIAILAENVKPPLILRSRRKGDTLTLAGGQTPVKDLLDRWGVVEADRDCLPILADREGVLAVLGGALGRDSRVRVGALAADGAGRRIIVHVLAESRKTQERGT
jgi:tRNA(Ile)-lysidine synthetase-like protein